MRIPLASLSPGRGGTSAGVGLYYNSKPYETFSWEDERYEGGSWSTVLTASDAGGWRYGFRYDMQLVHRWEESQPLHPSCVDVEVLYVWKLKIKFPDGSEHIFRPSGYTGYDSFYRIQPDGWMTNGCQADTHPITNGMTYYSADGTFMKLQFAPDGDHDWSNNPWTLSLPDGSRVTGGNAPQRIYDRNNNYIEIRNITYNGNPASEIIDQLGRHIIVEYDYTTGHDYVRAWRTEAGQMVELVWTITGGVASASDNSYYLNPNDIAYGGAMYGPGYAVVRRIDLPVQTGGLSYTFAYNSDDPGMGWGELSTMTLPSGAQINYEFITPIYTGLAADVLHGVISQKQLSYQAEYDGTSSAATETWHYGISETDAIITAPDGGVTHEYFYQTNVDSWGSGLVYKTANPDGSVIERTWRQNIPYGQDVNSTQTNPYTKTEFHSIRNAAGTLMSTAIKDYTYDKNGNLTQTVEYDWVNYADIPRGYNGEPTGIPGTAQLRRVSPTSYYNATPNADSTAYDPDIYTQGSTPNFRQAVASTEVSNGVQTLSRAEFFYDNPATTANVIQETNWDSTKGAYSNPLTSSNSISTSTQYNAYGSPILMTDGRGYQTLFVYGLANGFTDLYPRR